MESLYFILFTAILASGLAEPNLAKFHSCAKGQSTCTVTEVRIDPCKNPNKCEFKKESTAAISFDITPNFAATKLKTAVFWDNVAEIPFVGFGSDNGCDYTDCPTVAGQSQTMNYNMKIDPTLPSGTFPIIWKVWNEEDASQLCCFKTTIKLKK